MESLSNQEKLNFLFEKIKDCNRCPLGKTRTHVVFGEANADSKVIFIGEGPGKEEDIQGIPFVGRSGQLLSQAISEVFQWTRKNYYITNIVKCRPTIDLKMIKDRAPEKNEVEACLPILTMQLEIIKPVVIIAVGSSAAKALLNINQGITSIHGKWHDYRGISLMPIFHPSYVLRNGGKVSPQYNLMKLDLEKARDFINNN
ncbi:MAG: uracil-DNA glycosylase [Spirochaetia bacterium]|nr:uracil-DNA glycosylase [Spirochaetia bacterium]